MQRISLCKVQRGRLDIVMAEVGIVGEDDHIPSREVPLVLQSTCPLGLCCQGSVTGLEGARERQ